MDYAIRIYLCGRQQHPIRRRHHTCSSKEGCDFNLLPNTLLNKDPIQIKNTIGQSYRVHFMYVVTWRVISEHLCTHPPSKPNLDRTCLEITIVSNIVNFIHICFFRDKSLKRVTSMNQRKSDWEMSSDKR